MKLEMLEQILRDSDPEDKALQDCLLTMIDYYKNGSDVFTEGDHFGYILHQIDKFLNLFWIDVDRAERTRKYREYLLYYFKLLDIKVP